MAGGLMAPLEWAHFHSNGLPFEQHIICCTHTGYVYPSVKPLSAIERTDRPIFPDFSQKSSIFHQNVLHATHRQPFPRRLCRKLPIFSVDERKITFDLFLYLADRKYTAIKTVRKKEEVGVEFSHDTRRLSWMGSAATRIEQRN